MRRVLIIEIETINPKIPHQADLKDVLCLTIKSFIFTKLNVCLGF